MDVGEAQVYTDASWMVYVLDQLIGNAIKYKRRPEEGEPEETGRLSIWTEGEQEETKLFVEDNGEGIRKTDIRRIFEKGYTGSNYHNGKYKSTGMGLYMVSQIVQKLGHEIRVESKYGEYTRFFVDFLNVRPYGLAIFVGIFVKEH